MWLVFTDHERILLPVDDIVFAFEDRKCEQYRDEESYDQNYWQHEQERPFDVFVCVAFEQHIVADVVDGS